MLTASAATLNLSWIDNSNDELGFEIERAETGSDFSSLTSVPQDQTNFADSTVLPGVTYEYRVRAYNNFGYSDYTNVASGLIQNTAPSLQTEATVSALRGESAPTLVVTVGDLESDPSELQVEVESSSNPSLIDLSGISVSGDGSQRQITFSPVANVTGTSTITLVVSDGAATASKQITFTVLQNQAPTISTFAAKQVLAGESTAAIPFTIGDAETGADSLQLTASSSVPELVADGGFIFGGSGASRTIRVVSATGVSGSTNISVSVSDGVSVAKRTFALTVNPNTAPTITEIADQSVDSYQSLTGIRFTIGDGQTAAGSLVVEATTSNPSLIPVSAIAISGSGAEKVLGLHPVGGESGVATISIRISDGANETVESFKLTVNPPAGTVEIVSFRIEDAKAVVTVKNRPGSTFALLKTHTLKPGSWIEVADVETQVGAETTTIIDANPVDSGVCYRVKAIEQ